MRYSVIILFFFCSTVNAQWIKTITGSGDTVTVQIVRQDGLYDTIKTASKYRVDSLKNAVAAKQNTLVSGTTIKTINSQSLLGTGDISLAGGSTSWGSITGTLSEQLDLQSALDGKLSVSGNGSSLTGITKTQVGLSNVDNTSDASKPISTATQSALDAKQATLVSGTNIKTVNGTSVLGSGDIVISGGGMTRVFLPSDVVNNNATANTIADVTGLSFNVVANTTYQFRFVIVYSSAASTTGSRWSINGPATTHMSYTSEYTLTATSITNNQGLASYNVPSGASASSLTTNNRCVIEGEIRPSANGTVIARFASEISASAITAIASGRSYVEYQIIN